VPVVPYVHQIDARYRLSDELWILILPLLPERPPPPRGGRPRRDDRQCMEGILNVLRTSIPWRALPRCFGPATTLHDRFQEWACAGVFDRLWEQCLLAYDREVGIQWTWQSMDGVMTKAPLGGEATGPNPTDRAKSGTKRSLLTGGAEIPLAVVVAPANRNDCKLVEPALEARRVLPPAVSQHLCMDKGYDSENVRTVLEAYWSTHHIRSRGEELEEMERNRKRKARRWVVERAHAWMNQFRRLLIRWERKVANYLAFVQFACAAIVFRQTL
jgi:putative transposase